jgi:hypothetical protein
MRKENPCPVLDWITVAHLVESYVTEWNILLLRQVVRKNVTCFET